MTVRLVILTRPVVHGIMARMVVIVRGHMVHGAVGVVGPIHVIRGIPRHRLDVHVIRIVRRSRIRPVRPVATNLVQSQMVRVHVHILIRVMAISRLVVVRPRGRRAVDVLRIRVRQPGHVM